MPLAVTLWLTGAYLAGTEIFTSDAWFGRIGGLAFVLCAVALYRAQKVAKSATVWRDAAQAERASGEAWKSELEACKERAERLDHDKEDARRIVSEQLLELADLRAKTDLAPLAEAQDRRHKEVLDLLTRVVESNEKIVTAVVKNGNS